MSYFRGRDVAPVPNPDDAPFWAHCAQKRLVFQRCGACATVTHPPLAVCPKCQSLARDWVEAPTRARVYSFTWIHTAAHESVADCLPYNVAVVEFPDLPGVRLITNVIDAAPGTLAIGHEVFLTWETAGDATLPRFRKAVS
jgi:uncharacterized OB-fold protein